MEKIITSSESSPISNLDPYGVFSSSLEIQKAWFKDPQALSEQLTKLTMDIWSMDEWQRLFTLNDANEAISEAKFDQQSIAELVEKNPYLEILRQGFLKYSQWLEESVDGTPDVDEKTKQKAAFWTQQMLNAINPDNFFWSNPKAIKMAMETNGASLIEGMKNMQADMDRGTVSMVKEDAFEIGKDLANTPGAVVFRNEMLELIQYTPTTAKVHEVPIVIVTPWINKYYILDLNEKKSMVKHLVDQGYTVFITSWKNPGSEMRETSLDDYMLKGVLEAIDVARDICDVPQVHLAGYCIGGIIVTALMAWLNHPDQIGKGKPKKSNSPVADWTLFASMADFGTPGEIGVFIDEDVIQKVEELMQEKGYLGGDELAMSFRLLRSGNLIWNYVANSYLCGEEPAAFDVLFWNMDTTRMPEAMHKFYLRELYLENKLMQKDALILGGREIDLSRISQPLYSVGTEQDHIVPWKESFKTIDLISSPVRYALASSGHILGIVSPPVEPPKRSYTVSDVKQGTNIDDWILANEPQVGSWWDDWLAWLEPQSGKKVKAPALGGKKYSALEDAPGTYVLEK